MSLFKQFLLISYAITCYARPDIDMIDPVLIRASLEELTREPHPAGTDRDLELVDWIEAKFQEYGLDRTQRDQYDLLMSYPDNNNPNKVQLLDSLLSPQFTASTREEALRPEDENPDLMDAFLAFTPAGDAIGELVYVNYGREEDLDLLEEEFGISLEGKIAIARYGKNFRGNKVASCEKRGAIGVILYSDPEECTFSGTDPEDVYPNTRFLPGTGIQRGGTKVGLSGDPLSPGWPSIKNAFRLPLHERQGLPNIPAQPISYNDARVILEKLGGPEAPDSWVGGIEGITYKVGGQFIPEFDDWKVQITSNNIFDDTMTHINLMGVITGSEEPDRYVIISNHRDAWGFGANDPSGGTAIMMEMARIMGEEVKNGWRPRRTILFLSWAAEEHGLLGSTEWVFHKMPKLAQRAVAVVNLDNPIVGTFFYPRTSPSLGLMPVEVTKLVKNPFNESQSYYDFWKEMVNDGDPNGDKEPTSNLVGSGSDHDPFTFTAGVPSLYLAFFMDYNTYPGIYTNPTYHTAYETFYLVDKIIDPGFRLHKLCTEISLLLTLNLAEDDIVAFRLLGNVELMNSTLAEFDSEGISQMLEENGASLQYLREAIADLELSIHDFEKRVSESDLSNSAVRRQINDQMIYLERIFVAEGRLPGRQDARNVIYSHQKYNRYGASAFPGIQDLLKELSDLSDPDDIDAKWREIRKHVSDLMIAVRQTSDFLKPFEVL